MLILCFHGNHGNYGNHADYEAVVKLSEDFNGADLRNVCTEAGMLVLLSSLPLPFPPSIFPPSSLLLLPLPSSALLLLLLHLTVAHISSLQECLQFELRESL